MANNHTKEIYEEYLDKKNGYKDFAESLKHLICRLLDSEGLRYHSIDCRVKEDESLKKKIVKKGKYSSLSDITDIAGIRIITYYNDDVDEIAKLIEKEFSVDEDNTIDKRKALDPDRFGYLSLHYVIEMSEERLKLLEYYNLSGYKAEVQIRSILQHTWAEIEHDLGYKSINGIPHNIRRDFSRLAGLLELADKEFKEIRDKLKSYSEDVTKQIKQPSTTILIDKISIEAYYKSNALVKELSYEIIKLGDGVMIEAEENNFAVYGEYLKDAGFNSIQEIDNELRNSKDLCLKIAKIVLNGNDFMGNDVNSAIGLFYLCYVKLIKSKSKERVLKFLDTLDDTFDNEDFAERLMSTVKEF